jgi:hypothetical protein
VHQETLPHAEAIAHLQQAAPILGHIIARCGPCTLQPRDLEPLMMLCWSIGTSNLDRISSLISPHPRSRSQVEPYDFCVHRQEGTQKEVFFLDLVIDHSTPDPTYGAVSSGDRCIEGKLWTRFNTRFAKCNEWPKPHSPYSLPETTLALVEGTPRNPHEKAKAGNRSDYLVSRIACDRPDILERMKVGEFASVREAAREAGIIKDVSLVNQIVRL